MTPETLLLLSDLAAVIEIHSAEISYTTDDDGIHVSQGQDEPVCIGFISNGDASKIREIIRTNTPTKP